MNFIEKVKEWWDKSGLSNLVILAVGIICWVLGSSKIFWMCAGAFAYINFYVIKGLVVGIFRPRSKTF